MVRISLLIALVVCVGVGTLDADAAKRDLKQHSQTHASVPSGTTSVGIVFRAHVGARPQIVVDVPKLVYPAPVKKLRRIKQSVTCPAKTAAAIARDEGIRYQTIVRKKHELTVTGFRNGKKAKIRIANRHTCHILD